MLQASVRARTVFVVVIGRSGVGLRGGCAAKHIVVLVVVAVVIVVGGGGGGGAVVVVTRDGGARSVLKQFHHFDQFLANSNQCSMLRLKEMRSKCIEVQRSV